MQAIPPVFVKTHHTTNIIQCTLRKLMCSVTNIQNSEKKYNPKTEKKMIKSNNPTSSRYAVDLGSVMRFAF